MFTWQAKLAPVLSNDNFQKRVIFKCKQAFLTSSDTVVDGSIIFMVCAQATSTLVLTKLVVHWIS